MSITTHNHQAPDCLAAIANGILNISPMPNTILPSVRKPPKINFMKPILGPFHCYAPSRFEYKRTTQIPMSIINSPAPSETANGGLIGSILYPTAMTAIPKATPERFVLVIMNLDNLLFLDIFTSLQHEPLQACYNVTYMTAGRLELPRQLASGCQDRHVCHFHHAVKSRGSTPAKLLLPPNPFDYKNITKHGHLSSVTSVICG
jgi:hypothetical protein